MNEHDKDENELLEKEEPEEEEEPEEPEEIDIARGEVFRSNGESFYRILLDEDWDLRDLFEFPHALLQCYAFIYCLDTDISAIDREKIGDALESYPWQGGFSYINIYGVLENQIPKNDRPVIKEIKKASPGWLDLTANQSVMLAIAFALGQMTKYAALYEKIYSKANSIIKKIKKDRRDANNSMLKATAAELKEINNICTELAKSLGYRNLAALHKSTGDYEVSLKLLMAHARRMDPLLKYQLSGKVKFLTLADLDSSSSDERITRMIRRKTDE